MVVGAILPVRRCRATRATNRGELTAGFPVGPLLGGQSREIAAIILDVASGLVGGDLQRAPDQAEQFIAAGGLPANAELGRQAIALGAELAQEPVHRRRLGENRRRCGRRG